MWGEVDPSVCQKRNLAVETVSKIFVQRLNDNISQSCLSNTNNNTL